jgi:hypothetical protein
MVLFLLSRASFVGDWDGKRAGPWIELKRLSVNGWLFASIFEGTLGYG